MQLSLDLGLARDELLASLFPRVRQRTVGRNGQRSPVAIRAAVVEQQPHTERDRAPNHHVGVGLKPADQAEEDAEPDRDDAERAQRARALGARELLRLAERLPGVLPFLSRHEALNL